MARKVKKSAPLWGYVAHICNDDGEVTEVSGKSARRHACEVYQDLLQLAGYYDGFLQAQQIFPLSDSENPNVRKLEGVSTPLSLPRRDFDDEAPPHEDNPQEEVSPFHNPQKFGKLTDSSETYSVPFDSINRGGTS